MTRFRFVIERTTVERCEVEVEGDDLAHAAIAARDYPHSLTSSTRRRVRIVREFGDDLRSSDHEIVSGRAL